MPKPEAGLAGALSILLLCSCASQEPAPAQNEVAEGTNAVGANEPGDSGRSAAEAPGTEANSVDGPVPPPDAVSHPDGYLPPAPGESAPPAANSSGSEESPPATEDEYIRNRQAAR